MRTKTVTPAVVTLPLDRYQHIEFTIDACIMCGARLLGRRKSTCSAKCRKRASRRNEAIRREVAAIQEHLANLRRFADRWPDLHQDIIDAVQQSVTTATVTLMGLPGD